MSYTLEEHNQMISNLLKVVQSPDQIKFVMSLQYEISHKQIDEAQKETLRYRYELAAMEKALKVTVEILTECYQKYQ